MSISADHETCRLQIDQQIALLKERVDALRMCIVDMVGEEEDTKYQSEIFYVLLCYIKALEEIRTRLNSQP